MSDIAARLNATLADRYRLERKLGQGGMATVFLAEDLRHKRKVALKVLKPELAAVLGAERFVQEITTTASLQHPHILPLFDSGMADGFLYYVMPFIEGETLRDKLTRETQLGVDEAVQITVEVADALQYAHEHGVIHRDIKPENILLANGRPMVADFGIALAVSAAAGGRMTETGLSLGTPHYMSPEQATAEKEITGRSDIYSLASVLYEMLAGVPPHEGGSAQQTIMRILTETPKPVQELRRTVPPNVAAALGKALEKLPADRFPSAAAFAQALGSPGFRVEATGTVREARTGVGQWLRDPRSIGAVVVALAAAGAAVWMAARPAPAAGPAEYDIGLPDSAAMWMTRGTGFAVAPAGDFVVYQAVRDGKGEFWYRSLRDATHRRINGVEDGWQPAVSPDGLQIAFLRDRGASNWTLETIPVAGGTATTLGRGSSYADLQWLADGRIQVVENDGNHVRWFDPGGGPTTAQSIPYCIMPAPLPDQQSLLCGGGGNMYARRADLRDSTLQLQDFKTGQSDSSLVFGSHFQLVDGRYLVYVSIGGDLLAAPVNLSTRRVGRSVRLVTGLDRTAYYGAGSYAITRSGTLVYAQGDNHELGYLVAAGEHTMDTLQVGRDAFLRFALSPDGHRLAAVVQGFDGQELRVYDLTTGEHVMWVRHRVIRQPVWSPRGDSLIFSFGDSTFLGSPDAASSPELLPTVRGYFEAFSWMPGDRVIGMDWNDFTILSLSLAHRPITVDTLAREASFPRVSPDGHWLAYSNPGITAVWLEHLPASGERYQVATGNVEDPQWLAAGELVFSFDDAGMRIDRVHVDASGAKPFLQRRTWIRLPQFVGTAGQSYTLTRDGRVVYVRGAMEKPVYFLRAIPGWVRQMERAVDDANR